uniref:Putative LAGLIDADG homing endonuclease n=1 Tax=Elliptochloris bilobata TaxID=381761 RepID=A0A097KR19_9CHLO|nr:putative LAGLIDADG homing endonuclease [Elliptochloris bilobata]AIT95635.1 putative LAGLIDADG homing endonuclease [Elliptochloris bilobata]
MPRQPNRVSVTREQKEILLGILLGDAHMEVAPDGKSARLKIEQSVRKQAYVEHLHHVFQDWFPGKIVPASHSNNLKFSTKYSSSLLFYHTQFYGEKGRCVPRWMEHSFTARSLTYLFMDDGGIKSKSSKGVYINLYGLERKEQEFLCQILRRKFELQAKVVRDRHYYRIYISGHSYDVLVALLDPYILPSVRYKIPAPRKEAARKKPFKEDSTEEKQGLWSEQARLDEITELPKR